MNRILSLLFFLLSAVATFAALICHPDYGNRWLHEQPLNYADVAQGGLIVSCVVAGIALTAGMLLRRRTYRPHTINILLLAGIVGFIVVADRLVLFAVGLPYWVPDPDVFYRHRPNTLRTWDASFTSGDRDPRYSDVMLSFNQFGHHDDNFPEQKPSGQLRGLFLGDSVAMGQGVDKSLTFANQLENGLIHFATSHTSYQMINTGVQGYNTQQELQVFRQSLRFHPDFVVIAYCHNDIVPPSMTTPHGLISRLAGVQTNHYLARLLINETGFGRLIQRMRLDSNASEINDGTIDIADMAATPPTDSRYSEAWTLTKSHLSQIYALALEGDIHPILLILPDKAILHHPERHHPITELSRHAQDHGIDVLSMGPIFERNIDDDIAQEAPRPPQTAEELAAVRSIITHRYLFDNTHLTPEGHRLIADTLALYFNDVGIATLRVPAYKTAQATAYQLRDQRHYVPASLLDIREIVLGLRGLGAETPAKAVCRQAQNRYRSDPKMLKQLQKLCRAE